VYATAAYEAVGLTRTDHQYFGARIAPLGPVGPRTATAVLYGFAPDYVAAAVPGLWEVASPATIVDARTEAADLTLDELLGQDRRGPEMAEAVDLARAMVEHADFAARPLGAAWADWPWPTDPALVLQRACTVLREHRGDSHWAATLAEGIDAVECHVLHAADGMMPADVLQRITGWDDATWTEATERLMERGLVYDDDNGPVVTPEGRALKLRIEHATDRAAAQPIAAIGVDGALRFQELLAPWVRRFTDAGAIGMWKVREELWRDLPAPPEPVRLPRHRPGQIVRQREIALWGNAARTEQFRTTLGGTTGAPVGSVRAGWYRLASGASNPPDVHTVDEMYFITAGAARIELDGVTSRMEPGDTVLVPAGCHHQIHNDGSTDLSLVFLFSPAPPPRDPSGPPSTYAPLTEENGCLP
jgi:mannose-6-phosphate isomerase-like protein (cupin superfamily)